MKYKHWLPNTFGIAKKKKKKPNKIIKMRWAGAFTQSNLEILTIKANDTNAV